TSTCLHLQVSATAFLSYTWCKLVPHMMCQFLHSMECVRVSILFLRYFQLCIHSIFRARGVVTKYVVKNFTGITLVSSLLLLKHTTCFNNDKCEQLDTSTSKSLQYSPFFSSNNGSAGKQWFYHHMMSA
uniref:Uncharacterized protein n=1 Tax=Seriola dumerili TaxID=41447 RepID=A0A3B4TFY7_SERDU